MAIAWMPMYWGDYLADTMHLSTEEHGAYVLLIAAYWQRQKALPDDDRWLANITKLGPRKWRKTRKTLEHFFEKSDGVLKHKRLEKEIVRSSGRSAIASANAKRRLSGRTANHNHSHKEDSDESSPPISPRNLNGSANGTRKQLTDLADWQPDEQDRRYAEGHGLDADRILEDIRCWAANAAPSKRRKRDPRAFWQGWCRREADRSGSSLDRGRPGRHERRTPPGKIDAIARAARRGSAGAL